MQRHYIQLIFVLADANPHCDSHIPVCHPGICMSILEYLNYQSFFAYVVSGLRLAQRETLLNVYKQFITAKLETKETKTRTEKLFETCFMPKVLELSGPSSLDFMSETRKYSHNYVLVFRVRMRVKVCQLLRKTGF